MNTTILNYGLAKSEAVRRPGASSENKVIELEKRALFSGALHGARQEDFSEHAIPAILDSIAKVEADPELTPDRKAEIIAHYFDSPAVRVAYENRKAEVAALIDKATANKATSKKH